MELGIRADQPGTWSALEHYRLWGHWGEEDWSGASSGRTGVSFSVLGVEAESFHSGAHCATSRVCAGRGRGRELKHCVLLVSAGAILPSCSPGQEIPEEPHAQRPPESQHLPVPPHPPPVALPTLSEKWPPLSFLAFPLAPGRTLPTPQYTQQPAKAATDLGCPLPLVAGLWPLQWRSLTLRCPGRRVWGGGPAHHTDLWVSAL